jgi:hypothetical protein
MLIWHLTAFSKKRAKIILYGVDPGRVPVYGE